MPAQDYWDVHMAFLRSLHSPPASPHPYVTVIIPAYNEQANLGKTLGLLKETKIPMHVIVIDDGSKDQTANEAVRNGAEVVRLSQNHGKAFAYMTGIRKALEKNTPFTISLDADLTHLTKEGLLRLTGLATLYNEHAKPTAVKPVMVAAGFREGTQQSLANLSGIRCFNREAVEKLSKLRLRRFLGGKNSVRGFGLEVFLNAYFQELEHKKAGVCRFEHNLETEFHALAAYRTGSEWKQAHEITSAKERFFRISQRLRRPVRPRK